MPPTISGHRRQHRRCSRLALSVPSSYDALEEAVRRWISTCVASRTKTRRGVPIRREQELVTGNPSLKTLWALVLQHAKGQPVEIIASYNWGQDRVESITFSSPTSLANKLPPPVTAPKDRTEEVRVVVKSFIGTIGNHVGDLPAACELVPNIISPDLRLRWFASLIDQSQVGNEDPRSDAKNGKYRLYSERTFKVTIRDGKLHQVVAGDLHTGIGRECLAYQETCVTPPGMLTSEVSAGQTGPYTYDFSWTAEGRPHVVAEPGMQIICPRISRFIWHSIRGRIDCSSPKLRVLLWMRGSRFPSHRAFVNGSRTGTLWQGGLGELWHAHPKKRSRVNGMTFEDLPIRHPVPIPVRAAPAKP